MISVKKLKKKFDYWVLWVFVPWSTKVVMAMDDMSDWLKSRK